MHERIRFLEEQVRQLSQRSSDAQSVPWEYTSGVTGNGGAAATVGIPGQVADSLQTERPASSERDAVLEMVDQSPGEHSVSAILGPTTDVHRNEDFYGSSSAGTFMQNVKKLVGRYVGTPKSAVPSFEQSVNDIDSSIERSHEAPSIARYHNYVLPPRKTADRLMTAYWEHVHVLYPILLREEIIVEYHNLWSGTMRIRDERSLVGLIHAMLAISCQLVGPETSQNRSEVAAALYDRARGSLDIFEKPSLRQVQCYLVLAMYLQSTDDPHTCWLFVGLAVRSAQSLGLHLAATSERAKGIAEREAMRKAWYGCVVLDRVLAMTHGRAPMIGPQTATVVQLPWPEDAGSPDLSQDGRYLQPSDDFFRSAIKLDDLMHDMLFSFYRSDDREQSLDGMHEKSFGSTDSIFAIDHKLSKWEASLPKHLTTTASPRQSPETDRYRRQAVVLMQR